jgi:hypothetical protein
MTPPHLVPGDAIYSINGIILINFSSAGEMASYIRENCDREMTIEFVWKTVNGRREDC